MDANFRATARTLIVEFQSTRPWWTRSSNASRVRREIEFQSTRPWWTRNGQISWFGASSLVSIHAPVMDANWLALSLALCLPGFNPRARDGRENYSDRLWHWLGSFNPRARDGREDQRGSPILWWRCFNPRARDGRELITTCPVRCRMFQSTRPWWTRSLHRARLY